MDAFLDSDLAAAAMIKVWSSFMMTHRPCDVLSWFADEGATIDRLFHGTVARDTRLGVRTMCPNDDCAESQEQEQLERNSAAKDQDTKTKPNAAAPGAASIVKKARKWLESGEPYWTKTAKKITKDSAVMQMSSRVILRIDTQRPFLLPESKPTRAMTLHEEWDAEVLQRILTNDIRKSNMEIIKNASERVLSQYKAVKGKKDKKVEEIERQKKDCENSLRQIETLTKMANMGGEAFTEYFLPRELPLELPPRSRLYANGGAQRLPRSIRGQLFKKSWIDVGMDRSFFRMGIALVELVRPIVIEGLEDVQGLPAIRRWATSRPEVFSLFEGQASPDCVKTIVNAKLMGGGRSR